MSLSGKAVIAGIGATEFSKESGRSELQLSAEATLHALADAGLTPADVDGLVTFTMDNSSEIALARELGMGDLRFFSRINYGGGAACATVQQAAMAVATGVAETVVCFRGFNERSGQRFGQVQSWAAQQVNSNGLDNAWTYPHGLSTPAATVSAPAAAVVSTPTAMVSSPAAAMAAPSAGLGSCRESSDRHSCGNRKSKLFHCGSPIRKHE